MMSKIFRLLLWGYVLAHAWLSWRSVIWGPLALSFLIATDAISLYFVSLLRQKCIRSCIIITLSLLLMPLMLFAAAWLCDTFILSIPLAQVYNGLVLSPLWLPMWLFFILSVFMHLCPHLQRYELLARLSVLILSFWAAKDYQILFYSHPGALLFSLLIYLSGEALNLMQQNPAIKNLRCIPLRALICFIIFILPLTLACLSAYHFISNTMTKNTGGVLKPTVNSFDFNDSLSLENEIQLGQNLLLFVYLDQQPTEKMLFKRHDLAGYHPDKGFFAIKEFSSSLQVPKEPTRILSPKYEGRYSIQQEFFLINVEKDAFFSLDYPKEIIPLQQNTSQSRFRSSYLVNADTLLDRESLELDTRLLSAASTQLSAHEKDIYLDYAHMSEIADLARQVVGDEVSPYNQAKMLETYFKLHYLYSLKPGAGQKNKSNKEALYNFLFHSRKGYCTYFAFSMALMARSLGLPARIATGFFIMPQENLMGYYPVRGQQAHAWVEIFFDDFGWISFDPTSDQLAIDSLDSMNNTYEPDDLFPFVEEIMKTNRNSFPQQQNRQFKTIALENLLSYQFFSWQTLALVLLLLIVLYLSLLLWAHGPVLNIHHLSPRKAVQLCARRLIFEYNHFHKQPLTALEYLANEPQLLSIYRAALFSPNFTQEQARKFLQGVRTGSHLPRLNRPRRFFFIFSPSWIMFRINYVALF